MKTDQEYSDMADLHYAFQFGQDYVRDGYDESIVVEFEETFKGEEVYQEEFDCGVKYEKSKLNKLENK